MAVDLDLIPGVEPRTVEFASPISDALLGALLELAESAERNQVSYQQEPRLHDEAAEDE